MDKIIINTLMTFTAAIAGYSIFLYDFSYGLVYLVLLILGINSVVYSYCAKCPSCSKKCGHPQISFIRKFFPARKPGKYNISDYLGVGFFILVFSLLPLYFLWQVKILFILYLILSLLVLVGILTRFCTKCENSFCLLNRNPKFH